MNLHYITTCIIAMIRVQTYYYTSYLDFKNIAAYTVIQSYAKVRASVQVRKRPPPVVRKCSRNQIPARSAACVLHLDHIPAYTTAV